MTGAEHGGGPQRPGATFWAAERRERQELAAAFAAKARREMLDAGGIDRTELPAQARRILDWLADSDQPTVDGVAGLLRAAYNAGHAATKSTEANIAAPDAGSVIARLDALSLRPAPGLEL